MAKNKKYNKEINNLVCLQNMDVTLRFVSLFPASKRIFFFNQAYQSVSGSCFAFSVTKKTLKCKRGTQCKIHLRPQRLRSFWSAPRIIWLAEDTKRLFYAHPQHWTFTEVVILSADQTERGLSGRKNVIVKLSFFWPFSQRTYGLKDDKLEDGENNGWKVDGNNGWIASAFKEQFILLSGK